MGSNSTPLPKGFTTTSLPLKRYAFGNRTAWLRPDWNRRAVSMTGLDPVVTHGCYHGWMSACGDNASTPSCPCPS